MVITKLLQRNNYAFVFDCFLLPLYPKLVNKSVTDTFNFKERLVNVKLKDVVSWATKNMSTNWVTERTKIFRKAI